LQAIACGSDTVQYFQFRKSRGSVEQFHGAVVDHVGTEDTRVYREVAALGETMKKLAPVAGTTVHAKAALLFDWDNRWAIWDAGGMANATKNYEETCRGIHGEFTKMGVEMDVVGSDENLDDYKVVVAPMLYLLQPKTAENLKAFVARGGILLGTYMMGYVDKDQLCYLGGFPGDGLKEVFGIISEDLDVLYPSDRNTVVFDDKQVALAPNGAWEVREYAEVLKVQDAQVLGTYGSDFYAGNAALTVKEYGKGKAYYMAARVSAPQMRPLFERLCEDAGVKGMRLPENVECHVREGEEGTYAFYLNGSDTETRVDEVYGINAETGEKIEGTLHLGAYGALVVKVR
jgi:beta-galactosidase